MSARETLTAAALAVATMAGVAAAVVTAYPADDSPELAAVTVSTDSADTAREARRDALRWLASHPRFLSIPSCAVEDASSGPIPCTWNVHAGDGNGRGAAYLVTGTHAAPVFRYVHPAGRIVWGGAR